MTIKQLMALITFLGLTVAAFFCQDLIFSSAEWIKAQGLPGMLLFGLIYALATALIAPGLAMAMGAGYIYGPWLGLAVLTPASIVGSMAAFVLGRTYFRNFAQKNLEKWPHYPHFENAISTRGFWFLTLLFAYPLTPFRMLNYAISVTHFPTFKFLLVLLLSMGLHLLPYVYCGSIASNLNAAASSSIWTFFGDSPLLSASFFFGAIASFVVLFRYCRQILNQ